ncbi:MAG: glycosyltransferase family 4 protein, partial [Selenomonadaceae bacterium]|nr:glycosyltransferase family 4 protein [Selenomonadaceae bacterium]
EIAQGFFERGGIDPSKITVLAHGIDTDRYPQSSEELRRQLKLDNGLEPSTKILLFCARVVLNKSIDTVMKFCATIHQRYPSARLFVVGGGKTELLAQLNELSAKLDGSIIVTGEVDAPQRFYQMADVYVFPSRHEGLPTSLIEAMSSGLPSVVSDIGGCEDLIFDGVTGFRVPVEDADAYAVEIMKLFDDDDTRINLGTNAAYYVRRKCDYKQVIPRLAAIIEEG